MYQLAILPTKRIGARLVLTSSLLAGFLTASGVAQGPVPSADRTIAAEPTHPLVNAPVAPDAIYVMRRGAFLGVSVVDLNGFGQGCGDPRYDFTQPVIEGNTNFPNNPNVSIQGAILTPPLQPGTRTYDGGSSGVFSLARDARLDDVLVNAPDIVSVRDMMLGHPLDLSFNSGAVFGCAAGGGNICASSFLQVLAVEMGGPHTLQPAPSDTALHVVVGGGNPISFAPHPNPPPLTYPPLCLDPLIAGMEPTAAGSPFWNLLVPGDPFGIPEYGIPPTGLLSPEQNAFFQGPTPPQSDILDCAPFMIRQQIGHFLYVADRARGEITVLNSNTFRVLDRIAVTDPVELAMSPNLDFLAVSDQLGDRVWFIDIDPASSAFHEVVQVTDVGRAPRGIAWDPGNEDILVANAGDDTVSIIAAATLTVRKVVSFPELRRPFAVAITPRQDVFGFERNVYFAYVLDRKGHVFLFESGPDGPNGWGYDDFVGQLPVRFSHPRALQPDHRALGSGVWIAHQGQLGPDGQPTGLGGGAITNVLLDAAITGAVPLIPGEARNLRDLTFTFPLSIGSDQLGGVPTDLAFDDLRNLGALPNHPNAFSVGIPAPLNGKGLVRSVTGLGIVNTNEPTYLFAPVFGTASGDEEIAVIDLATGLRFDTNAFHDGAQAIPAAGAVGVMDYFRQ